MLAPSQDWYTLQTSAAKAEATYTYELPPARYHVGCIVMISCTAETGTSTLDAKLQYKMPLSLAWTDLPGAAFVQWGDGSTAEKFLEVYPGITGGDSDNVIAMATAFNHVGVVLPRWSRLSVTVGGTSVTRTFSAGVLLLP